MISLSYKTCGEAVVYCIRLLHHFVKLFWEQLKFCSVVNLLLRQLLNVLPRCQEAFVKKHLFVCLICWNVSDVRCTSSKNLVEFYFNLILTLQKNFNILVEQAKARVCRTRRWRLRRRWKTSKNWQKRSNQFEQVRFRLFINKWG